MDNDLHVPNKSAFHPEDSTINQLLYINHEIFRVFEDYRSRKTRAEVLEILCVFDMVCNIMD